MDALIIKEPHISRILRREKTWEIRGSNTNKRGTIGLIRSGSKQIIGEIDLIDSFPLSKEDIKNNKDKHHAKDITYKKPHAWVLSKPISYKVPKPYEHPKGAIIWVKV